ncbi:MAG: M48 family metalloprotease [Candidatus Solibacter usitatus]|nr:M48 family metalloprotease [Candidatus Solibacter usitatus]
MHPARTSAIACASLLCAGALLTALGNPERQVDLESARELWAELFRDADQFGMQLSRVSAREEMDLGNRIARSIPAGSQTLQTWGPYVDAVGQRLAKHVVRKEISYTFHVISSSEQNAFALPGGHVFVHEGLLGQMRTEAELAGVLGHEIAHVDSRHCIERFQVQLRLRRIGLENLNLLADVAKKLMTIHYAKYQEFDADLLGLRLVVEAGYDPNGISDLFTRVFREYRHTPDSALETMVRLPIDALTEYLRSHPLSADRVRRLKAAQSAYARKHDGKKVYRGGEDFPPMIPGQF